MIPLNYLLLSLLLSNSLCEKSPCPEVLTVDITDGEKTDHNAIIKDKVRFEEDNYYVSNNSIFGCICNVKQTCIRKCCGPDEIMVNKTCTLSNKALNLTLHHGDRPKDRGEPHFIHNSKHCKSEKMLLMPHFEPSDQFYIQGNGSLFLPKFKIKQMRDPEDYCVEVFHSEINEMDHMVSVLLCLSEEDFFEESDMVMFKYGMIISMPFLLLTFIAYALLPDRNLHMKALMFYVINLMFSYLLLVIIQLSESQFAEATCKSLGYFCLFFFLVSFFWMNVICIDIWWGFSGLRGFTGSKKTAERKRFLFYCAYAWGMPVLHVLVVFIIDILANQNSVLKPDIGNGQCFLRRGFPELLYFYGPMAILITINIVLFAITAIKIRRIKSETAMLKKEDSKRHSYENDRQIFNLYVKLLFAMGVNWSMEIISWAVIWAEEAPEAIWYLTDFCNAIYGVFIFFIFVFKRSIWKLLKKRFYWSKPKIVTMSTIS
ncbi:G-protein coupled receptor Mth2 isoform X6 [Tribolium castaneum]|uniref:G-protein coupled receptor Mth2 isoform X6 n=1 Tax=Tribolium castaneum TaxID=7070 RepID=UPI0030FED19F